MLYDHTVCYGNIRRNAHQLPYSLHGVGWCWDVNVPLTTFPRPCRRCWCFARVGWGGVGWGGVGWGCSRFFDHVPSTLHKMLMLRSHGAAWGGVGMFTFLRPRSLDLAQDFGATLTWGGVGWGGDAHVPSTTFPRPCTRIWCYAHMEQGGDVDVPSTTFPWPCTRSSCSACRG